MGSPDFARIAFTPEGQVLAFLDQNDEGDFGVRVVIAPAGLVVSAFLGSAGQTWDRAHVALSKVDLFRTAETLWKMSEHMR